MKVKDLIQELSEGVAKYKGAYLFSYGDDFIEGAIWNSDDEEFNILIDSEGNNLTITDENLDSEIIPSPTSDNVNEIIEMIFNPKF